MKKGETRMDSHEAIRTAVEKAGVKRVAAEMEVSTSLIYKWCEPAKRAPDDDERSGTRNPLDRMADLLAATDDPELVAWLCERAGGYFVRDPNPPSLDQGQEFVRHTHRLLEGFSDLLRAMSKAIDNDNCIDVREARQIRTEWQELKRYGEALVVACERGLFAKADRARG